MGQKLIIKNVDFSENYVSVSPNYEEEVVGTSESLWSYATSSAGGGSSYGFIAQFDMYVTEVIVKSFDATTNAKIRVNNQGNNTPVQSVPISGIASGLNHITLSTPILVRQGQIIGLSNAKIYYCEPSVQKGDYPSNNYDGNIGTYDVNPRCYTINFIAQKEID